MLLVDAANVVGSVPDGWWRDRPGAARRLLARLPALLGGDLPAPTGVVDVVVVLEGQARRAAPQGRSGGVDVRHADGSGDDLLAELAAPGTLLVTADRELAARGRARGAYVEGPRWLLDRLGAQPS